MRRIAFYAWCIGGLLIVGLGMRYVMRDWMTQDMAIGFGFGVLFCVVLFAINERLDILAGRRDSLGRRQ